MSEDINKENLERSWKLYDCKCDTIEFLSKYIKDYESKILWVIISSLTVIGGLLVYVLNYILSNMKSNIIDIEYSMPKIISLALIILIVLFLSFIGYKIITLYFFHCRSSMENHIKEIDSCVIKVMPEFAAQFLLIRIENMKKTLDNIDKSIKHWKNLIITGLIVISFIAVAIISIQFLANI